MKWIKLGWKKIKLSRKQRLLAALAGVAIVATLGFYLWGNQASAAEYMTARVEGGNLRNTVTATGTLQAVTTVQVGSQASGTISALYADFNSIVKKGQVIAQLNPAVSKAQVDQSRANLQQARASLQQARAGVANSQAGVTDAQAKELAAKSTAQGEQAGVISARANLAVLKAQLDDAMSFLRQQESLVKAGVIAQRDLEMAQTSYKAAEAKYNQAEAQLNQATISQHSAAGAGVAQSQAQVQQAQAQVLQAQAQVQQAEAALRLAEVNLAHTTIVSPIDGVVVSRDVNVGQTVAASLSAPTLFTIANDLTQMQVIANIDQADIGLVEQAKSVKFAVDAFPDKEFNGQIQQLRLNPVSTQNVVTYNVVIDVNNPEQKLKPGMTANLTITIDERNNVLKIPNAALRFIPQDAQRTGGGQRANGAGRSRGGNAGGQGNITETSATGGQGGTQSGNGRERNFAPPTAPVLSGQTRIVWVLSQDKELERRRITIGLTDGVSTELLAGELKEGDLVVTGQTITGANRPQTTQSQAPGFGGAPRGGGRR
ncbi:MAG TPA: efflux RND transporter periplasmic adaptor subunit [Pyrinomonadaceae bacterium]|nr:efflux RND transporter periplasmic adaptor subunit [Pyrinomonadaceae bacterium]